MSALFYHSKNLLSQKKKTATNKICGEEIQEQSFQKCLQGSKAQF